MRHLAVAAVLAMSVATILAMSTAAIAAPAAEKTFKAPGVIVTYSGIGEPYARAIGRTVSAARATAATRFGFDMPETVRVTVACAPGETVRLFTDGADMMRLSVSAEKDLLKPATTGTFHLYGLCHEVGHLAQYRAIRTHDWMTSACAEGWAHYLGSRLVDIVYAQEGADLWPDPYDYRADGMARLTKQVAQGGASDVERGAALWMDLAKVVGDRGIAPVFAAWGKAKVDASDPGPALAKALPPAPKGVAAWWTKAEPVLVAKRARSSFIPRTISARSLRGKPVELKHDDGAAAGKASMAGGGHAVRFEAPGEECYLVGVSIYGSRYGGQPAASEQFHVWLCDEEFKTIADFPFPYTAVDGGSPKWVRLPVPPTLVPAKFIVCAGFNPTASKGVFVHYDGAGGGESLSGLPGEEGSPFAKGDWMIRAAVDQSKSARPARR